MTSPYKNIAGKRFGRLVAISIRAEKYKRTKWLCKCDCGQAKLIPLDSLTSGKAISCGCFRKEVTRNRAKKHGLTNEHLYKTWINMRSRCSNPKVNSFKNYGERGISVCEEWNDFEKFYNWSLNNGYQDDLTIDRIDNDGNYEPGNCRWANREVQMNNTSKNVKFKLNGKLKTIAEHAKSNGLNYSMFYYRYEHGLCGKELVMPSRKKRILIEIDGVTKNLKGWSKDYGISYSTLQNRYRAGLRGKDLFKPVNKIMSEKAKKRKKQESV